VSALVCSTSFPSPLRSQSGTVLALLPALYSGKTSPGGRLRREAEWFAHCCTVLVVQHSAVSFSAYPLRSPPSCTSHGRWGLVHPLPFPVARPRRPTSLPFRPRQHYTGAHLPEGRTRSWKLPDVSSRNRDASSGVMMRCAKTHQPQGGGMDSASSDVPILGS
jgi:hypothetical protein